MADGNAARGLGPYQDSGLGMVSDGPLPVDDSIQDRSTLSDGDISRAFMASAAAWDLDVLHPDDPYDINTASVAGQSIQSDRSGCVSPSWQAPQFDQRQILQKIQQQIHPLEASTGYAPTRLDPPRSTFEPGPMSSLTRAAFEQKEPSRVPMSPNNLPDGSLKSPSSPESAKTGNGSSPDASGSSQKGARKRKVSAEFEDGDDTPTDEPEKPMKKTAHNMIEKRYRNNINDKIAALRDSVPSLRIMSKSAKGEDTTEDREELDGLTPAHKLNKATVLSKATEYIRHLEKRNNRLLEENGAMQARLAAFEKLWMGGAMNDPISLMPQQPTSINFAQEGQTQPYPASSSMEPMRNTGGMMDGVTAPSEEMKTIMSAQTTIGQPYPMTSQATRYPDPQLRAQAIQTQPQGQADGWSETGTYLGKMMVSTLAGLMILEAVREDEQSSEKPQGRGLLAVPIQLARYLPANVDLRVMGYHHRLPLKFLLLTGLLLWAYAPSLFTWLDPKPRKQFSGMLQAAPSCAAPIATRRKAWLTSIQTVWVPHHNVFLEAAALLVKTAKLSIRKVFGDDAYRRLTGMSEEEEVGRVKAWTIALESQLAGADEGICGSRLLLTLLASGTLPDTPVRLMLKALHIRLLLWSVGHPGSRLFVLDALAARLARSKWNRARELNQLLREAGGHDEGTQHEDELPDHLAALVEQDCDEVLNPMVIQRAHNLAFNEQTSHGILWAIEGMDAVVEDTAVTAPMDAVAAWWSTEILHDVLAAAVDKMEDAEIWTTRASTIELAIEVAPAGSMALARATLARAVLTEKMRGANIAAVAQAIHEGAAGDGDGDGDWEANPPAGLNKAPLSSGAYIKGPDSQLSLGCASALAHLKRMQADAPGSKESLCDAIEKIMVVAKTSSMSFLSYTFVMEVVDQVLEHGKGSPAEGLGCRLEELVKHLRIWMGSPLRSKCGVGQAVQEKAVNRCLNITKTLLRMDDDPGYSSMSEDEDDYSYDDVGGGRGALCRSFGKGATTDRAG